MRITKRGHRSHEGRDYWKILPLPDNEFDQELLSNCKVFLIENGTIIHTFFETIDPILNLIMDGNRGEVWEYLPLNEERVD